MILHNPSLTTEDLDCICQYCNHIPDICINLRCKCCILETPIDINEVITS